MKTHLDLQKRFPIFHVCPKCLAAILCGWAFLQNGFAFLQELDEVGMTLVEWKRGSFHCVLIQHPETLLNRSLQFIFILQFLYSAIKFHKGVLILDWFRLAIVSNVEL